MELFARPVVAVAFGVFIVCAETCLHFESLVAADWLDMPWHNWIAGGWLIVAGTSVGTHSSRVRLAAPWPFMLSLLVGALFGLWGEWRAGTDASDDWLSVGTLLSVVIGLMGIAIFALVGILRARAEPGHIALP